MNRSDNDIVIFLEISFNQKIFRAIKFVKYEKIDWILERRKYILFRNRHLLTLFEITY